MGKAIETATPPPLAVEEEQPSPDVDPPGPTTLISLEQLEQIDTAESAAERVERLQGALGVQHYPVNPRTSVWVDFCFGVLNFARDEARLPSEKTLSLLTLAHEVYVFATQPPPAADSSMSKIAEPVPVSSNEGIEPQPATKVAAHAPRAAPDEYPTTEAVYDHFRDKIRHTSGVLDSRDQPTAETTSPLATPFSPMQVARIVAFFTSTFFRHLRAYQYLHRVPRPSVVRESTLPTETPLPPAALADASLHAE
ncbi:hypothetical protein PRNP1_011017 [Phytophthora ramorum]